MRFVSLLTLLDRAGFFLFVKLPTHRAGLPGKEDLGRRGLRVALPVKELIMNVVAFNGSPRAQGNTAILLNRVLAELTSEGIGTELVSLAGKRIAGCRACFKCFERSDGHCAVTDDILNDCIDKMRGADGIIMGSPTYFSDVTAGMKALIERSGMTARANPDLLRRKVGAGVVAVRRAGAIHAFNSLNLFFLIGEMIVVGSSYWNIGVGRDPGAVENDEEGIRTMETLGRNMAWLLKRIRS